MIKINSIVKLKAKPNSGEMIVIDIKDRYLNHPHASSSNPVIFVKFWDDKKNSYEYEEFYSNALEFVK